MVPMIVLTGVNCAYCKKAKMLIKRAIEKKPEFARVKLIFLEENSPEGSTYPHRFVPAFYSGRTLRFEGNPSMQDIELLLSFCLQAD
jgi:glutaredoxin